MNTVCALDIQDALKRRDCVSVPWIQSEYGLDYLEAKLFLEQLLARGWIEKEPKGIQYGVLKENLRLRKIARSEVYKLIEDVTHDCISALNCILKKGTDGASFEDMSDALRGDGDANAAIEILEKHMLIYCIGESYFSSVSKMTIDVLSAAVRMKRSHEASLRLTGKRESRTDIVRLFDKLFA